MKKIIPIILVAAMALSFSACGAGLTSSAQTAGESAAPEVSTPAPTESVISAEDVLSDAFVDPLTGWGAYDKLIDQMAQAADASSRAQLMHDAEDMLMASWCVLPLYSENEYYLVKSSVGGIYADHSGALYFPYATLPETADTLRVALAVEPDSLDPIYDVTSADYTFTANLFTGLYTVNEDGDTVPALADSIATEDGLTYTVTLKSNLRWSTGWNSLSANDFVYSWKRMATAEETSVSELFSIFEGFGTEEGISVSAVDSLTLTFTLNQPCPYIEELLSQPAFAPVMQSEAEKYAWYGDQKEPGAWAGESGFQTCGPYTVTAWEKGSSMTLEKNPYWYDADNIKVEKIVITFTADEETAFNLFKNGRTDVTNCIPASEWSAMSAETTMHTAAGLGTCYATFNAAGSLFKDKTAAEAAAMRQAFSLLIDREYLCSTGGTPASAYIPSGMSDGNGKVFRSADEEGYYDPYALNNNSSETLNQARALLAAAGYEFENGRLSSSTPIEISCVVDEAYADEAACLQQDFTMLGITVTVRELSEKDNAPALIARADLTLGSASAAIDDPQTMLVLWTTSNSASTAHFGA